MAEETTGQLSPNKQALLKIRELKHQLAVLQSQQSSQAEPVAVVSMACRFPRTANTPEAFWQSLLDRTDLVGEIPPDRWDLEAFYDEDPDRPGFMYARHGVFLEHLDQMDPEFFGISPREATWVDPQQRLLLEVGWEALERAGWRPEEIGKQAGVFVGWMHNDYQNEASDSFLNLNPYIATGAAGSFLCGRLAYYLGLQGPSVAIDTACSSSLVALHLACQSLQLRECDFALVGGVNAICSPTTNILTCKLKALSPTGQSRAFDADADGYLRGEGCGVVTLRRLSDAQRDGDAILGVIRGTAVGHNGFSSGLTAPNPKAQEQVIRTALRRADVDPRDVAYLEAHGTGTELGDPIEVQAASAALTRDRDADQPLLIGSVKTNIGHLEAAAGMAGLIKTLLALQHRRIPAQLNFDTPNPHIDWAHAGVRVVTELTEWPHSQPPIAGVSAFGMSGTNAHVIVEGVAPDTAAPEMSEPHLILLSGRTTEAVQTIAADYERCLSVEEPPRLIDMAYTSFAGRTQFDHRAAVVASDHRQAIEHLNTLTRGGQSNGACSGIGRRVPKVAWQFTGQGSQYAGMARGLYESQPVFRAAIDWCDKQLAQFRAGSLCDVLFGADDGRLHHTHWTQPAIFAVQMGLAKLLAHFQLTPDAVLGHSVGQYAAACVAGVMSWEQGLFLISERGRLIGELPAGGQMLAVFAPATQLEDVLDFDGVGLAAFNGTHVVLSGPQQSLERVAERLSERQIRCKPLKTSHAFHSALMDPAVERFAEVAAGGEYGLAQIPLICNMSGQVLDASTQLDAEYWARHIREPVRYAQGIEAVQELGCELLLEIGPQATLTRMASANWRQPAAGLLSCLNKGEDESTALLNAVARMYVQGCSPDLSDWYQGRDCARIVLPTYPFQRRRFWGPDKPRASHAEFHTAHPLLGARISLAGTRQETRYESFIEADSPPWLPDHQVMDETVLPGAAYLEMALAAAGPRQIEDIVFEQPLRVTARTTLQTLVHTHDDRTQTIEIYSSTSANAEWTRHFQARMTETESDGGPQDRVDLEQLQEACPSTAEPKDFYAKMRDVGLGYGPEFQRIDRLRFTDSEVLASLTASSDIRGFRLPPPLLDAALHSLAVGLLHHDDGHLFLPVGVQRLRCYRPAEDRLWSHARWLTTDGSTRTADLTLYTESGELVAEIQGLRVRQVNRAAIQRLSGRGPERLLYTLNWEPFRLPATDPKRRNWLLVGSASQSQLDELQTGLEQQGHQVTTVVDNYDSHLQVTGSCSAGLNQSSFENWSEFVDALKQADAVPDGIAWIPGGDTTESYADASADQPLTAADCLGLLTLVQALIRGGIRQLACGLQLITRDAIAVEESAPCDPRQTMFWGFGRVIGAEQPGLRCRLIDVATADSKPATAAVLDILTSETQDNQFAVREQQCLVPRLLPFKTRMSGDSGLKSAATGCYLITGGLGVLGRAAAEWLAKLGARQIVLVSRRAPDATAQAQLNELEALGCEVVVHLADLSSRADVEQLFGRFGNDLRPLAGVIHAAGVVDDALLSEQTAERFEKVLRAKLLGATWLHEFTRSLDLDFFVLYSSASSVFGTPGQSNYATANAFCDGLAWFRRSSGLPALSINWGPWSQGMADDERIRRRLAVQGITPLEADEAHAALELMLAAGATQATAIDADWRRMQLSLGEAPPLLDALTATSGEARTADSELIKQLKQLTGIAQKQLLVQSLQESLKGILSTQEDPDPDRPLIEMGLDSLMAVEFSAELQAKFGDQFGISPTMLFDYPSIDAISEFFLEQLAGTTDSSGEPAVPPPVSVEPHSMRERDQVAIIGMSCRFPGARDLDEFWQNLLHEVDSVGEIPEDRWDIDRFYSAERLPGKMYTREGGFLPDIAEFDAAFFHISDQEACWIDPQHRLLLENSYRAFEHAGIPTHPLEDTNVGVFMGIMGQDYAFLPRLEDDEVIKGFQGAGLSHSAGVGRISYVFGFEGPSVAVDTASSSSLVALLQAVRSLQDGQCNMALAGGVNAILAPVNSLLMSKAALLSPDGRCKSFSAQADGFGRGEGCGVVLLKRLQDATRDGDRVLAVIRGGAVVHNGFSSGITAPSGKSQSRVISEALQDANIAPAEVQYLEAHGTGTEFGDPLELGAAAAVYGKGRSADHPLLVGSVKANISHLEAAGGISGLIKTVLCLHHGEIPPQIHFDSPSPHVPWQRMPLSVVKQTTKWPEVAERIAGVTALGLVGTNAHVILSSPAAPQMDASPMDQQHPPLAEDAPPRLLVLSAGNDQALDQLARQYQVLFAQNGSLELADVCHTSATGRRHFDHRLAVTARSVPELMEKLAAYLERDRQAVMDRAVSFESQAPYCHGQILVTPKVLWTIPEAAGGVLPRVRELYLTQAVFREFVSRCDARLERHTVEVGGEPLQVQDSLQSSTDESHWSDRADLHQFLLQAGLAQIWLDWGLEPDAVYGTGVGQYTAACVAGVLSFEDAVTLVVERDRVLKQTQGSASSAGNGSADSSAATESALARFEEYADTLNYYPPKLSLVCSLDAECVPIHRSLGGSYWRRHVTETWDSSSRSVATSLGCDLELVFLQEDIESPTWATAGGEEALRQVVCLQPDHSATAGLMRAAGELYVRGFDLRFERLDESGSRRRVSLPHYPFQRKRYWITEIAQHTAAMETQS